MRKLFTFLAVMLMAFTAYAKVWEITPTSPREKDNIRYCLRDNAAAGDTILLTEDGPYGESDAINIDKSIVIMAEAGVKPQVNLTYYTKIKTAAVAKIIGLTFNGGGTCEYAFRAYDNSATAVTFENCEFTGFAKYVITSSESYHMDSCVVNNCYFHDNGRAAVYFPPCNLEDATVNTVDYVRVTNSTITNVTALNTAIIDVRNHNQDYTENTRLEVDHCTFFNWVGGTNGAVMSYKSPLASVTNCIFAEPEATTYYAAYCYGGDVKNCLSFNVSGHRDWDTHPNMVANITGDPLFNDAANGDYSLKEGSPALGAGTDGSNLGDPRWWPAAPAAKDWCELEVWHFYGVNPDGDPNSYALLSVIDNEDGTITFKIANDAAKNTQTFDYLQINPLGIIVGADAATGESSISGTYTVPGGISKLENLEILWSTPNWDGRWMVQNLTIDLANDELCPGGPIEVNSVEMTINEPKAGEVLPHKTLWPTYPEFNVIGGIVLPDGAKYQITQYTYYNSEGNTPAEDNFLPNTTYKMIALVEPLDGYSFPLNGTEPDFEHMAITINNQLITDFSSGFGVGDGIFSFEYTFTTGAIEIKDVEIGVTVPQAGDAVESRIYKGDALFDTFASLVTLPAGANYEIDRFEFFKENGTFVEDNSTLAANTTYRLGINIAPKEGYAFPMNDDSSVNLEELNLTVNHNGTSYNPYNGWGYFGITVYFTTTSEIPTGLNDIEDGEKAVKFIENGQLFVIKNGVKYNAQGAIVK